MIFELTEDDNVRYLITCDWLSVTHVQRYIGTVNEVLLNQTMCGLIVDSSELGYMDYQNNKYGLKARESFKSLMKRMEIIENEFDEWKIYKIILK